jgi:sucrose-6-phosphate hydrolase SacC (GH32 family)
MTADTVTMIADARALREALLADPHRPLWHFVAPEGFAMPFDPNGAIFWNGRYHLGFIFQDARGHCWGHASSHDLLHWRLHTPWLVPAPGDVDHGIFSGNAFRTKDGAVALLYHGVDAGNCIATSADPQLDGMVKLPANPIVPNPTPGSPEATRYHSWDPHGWLEGDTYYAVFGGTPGSGVAPSLFTARALDDWAFVGPFMTREMPDVAAHEDVSCPDFFALGDRHVLVCISHSVGARYYTGRWDGTCFTPEVHRRMNWPGGTCFAPETLLDDRGRRILWTWALETRPAERAPWGGVMTLPRVLSPASDGTLTIDPVEELSQLHAHETSLVGITARPGRACTLPVSGDSLELDLTFAPGSATRFGLNVRCSPDGEEETVIRVDRTAGTLTIDVAKSTLDPEIVYRTYIMLHGVDNPTVTAQVAPFTLDDDEPLRLRIFLDRSILEVFANRRQCLTQRIYPTRPDSLGVALFSEDGEVTIERGTAWEMAATNGW